MSRPTPLTATDAAFLHQEAGAAHMSVGGLARFDGPGPTIEELRAHTLRRLHLIPRYRQRLVYPPAGIGRPLWADAPGLRHREPRPPRGARGAGRGRGALGSVRAGVGAPHRPHAAAVGAVPGRGSAGWAVRDHRQEPPRLDRRHLEHRRAERALGPRGHALRHRPRRSRGLDPRCGAIVDRPRAGRGLGGDRRLRVARPRRPRVDAPAP